MILIQIFASLIINQFGFLTEKGEDREEMLTSQCFVCGESKSSLDQSQKNGYYLHINTLHSLWAYLHYMHFVKHTSNSKLALPDKIAKSKIFKGETTWIPFANKKDDD